MKQRETINRQVKLENLKYLYVPHSISLSLSLPFKISFANGAENGVNNILLWYIMKLQAIPAVNKNTKTNMNPLLVKS